MTQACPDCGAENPAENRFCGSCGASLTRTVERRRLVTSVFCDLSGSTALGERVDAESVFELMRSYYENARRALERHGGAVEKFIGDAVVGMFGVTEANEDDALRACRAALEIQEQVSGADTAVRIGINSGEVVAGDAARREMFASGDAVVLGDSVNVAARLEQAAPVGQILLGEATYRLVRDAVTVEQVAPVEAKGKSEPLTAYRLVNVHASGRPQRRSTRTLVGRDDELATLRRELEGTVAGACRLVTIVGEPGVGKSRLAAELLGGTAGVRVTAGACPSYGDGISFWAIAQIVRDLAGIRDDHSAEEARDRVPARLAQLLGLSEGTATAGQTARAIAEFLAGKAAERPLVVVVDDLQWAEPALLDLVAALPGLIGEARVLLLCLARRELLEVRPDWPVAVELGPLGPGQVEALLDDLGAPAATRVRIALAAAGNPLYAEELVGWAAEGGDLDVMPTSLNALLGARLDRLQAPERDALERGAIEGELFHHGAVVELTDHAARPAVAGELDQLTRKDLIRLAAASFAGELIAYRFKHILVREAAYRATTKKLRAALHERYADWLEQRAGDRVGEYHEILGYHLEQAHGYRVELGTADPALAARAGHHLGAAGRRAAGRSDYPTAESLLGRAGLLLAPDDLERLGLMRSYAWVIAQVGRTAEAEKIFEEVAERASELGSPVLAARARNNILGIFSDPNIDYDAARRTVEEGLRVAREVGDEAGLAEGSRWLGLITSQQGRYAEAAMWLERGLVHAEACDDQITLQAVGRSLAFALEAGPMPAGAAVERCEELFERNREDPLLAAMIAGPISVLYAMTGDLDRSQAYGQIADRVFGKAETTYAALAQRFTGTARSILGDFDGAAAANAAKWRFFSRTTTETPDGRAIDAAGLAAFYCCAAGRWDDAEHWASLYRHIPGEGAHRLAIEAQLSARRGDLDVALALARRAVEIQRRKDSPEATAGILRALAAIQRAAGENHEADATLERALALYEQKGDVTSASRLREAMTPV
jgi:class 3 adenylate cyclase/tetratricopeptide (TPR) repeat protein